MKAEELDFIKGRASTPLNRELNRTMDYMSESRQDIKKLVAEVERLRSVVWRISDYCDMSIKETEEFLNGADSE